MPDAQAFWDALVKHKFWAVLATVAFLILVGALARLGERILDSIANLRLAGIGGLRKYRLALQHEYTVHPLGFEDFAVDIEKVYQPAEYASPAGSDLVSSALSRQDRALVLGQAGAGKTLFLKRSMLEWAQLKRRTRRRRGIPVFVQLHRLTGTAKPEDLVQLAMEELRIGGVRRPKALLNRVRRRGGMTFLFDGLDEVPEDFRPSAVTALQGFARDFRDCRIVVTSRETSYRTELTDAGRPFARVSLLDLDDAAMFRMLRQLDGGHDGHAPQLIQVIRANPGLLRMARNPLMLTIIAFVHGHSEPTAQPSHGSLPTSRAALYQSAIRHLIGRDQARGVRADPAGASTEIQHTTLRALALALLDGTLGMDRVSVGYQELLRFLSTQLNAIGSNVQAETLLEALTKRSQLLVADRDGSGYRFRHQTFCDALAAQQLSDSMPDLLQRYLAAPRDWRETLLSWCGLSRPQVSDMVAALFADRAPEHRLLALECLTETDRVDSSVAQTIVAYFEARLGVNGGDSRVATALGAIAGQEPYGGRALFDRLADIASSGPVPQRESARVALSASNLSKAADILTDLLEADPSVRGPLRGLGQVALEALRNRARQGSVSAVDVIGSIRTPDAVRALLELVAKSPPIVERVAWRLAEVCVDEASMEVLRSTRLQSLDWSAAQIDAAAGYRWVWEPFDADTDKSTALPTVMGFVATVLDGGSEPVPDDIEEIPWQLAVPICVIGICRSSGSSRQGTVAAIIGVFADRIVSPGASGSLLGRLVTWRRAGHRPDLTVLDHADLLTGQARQLVVSQLKLQGDQRYLRILAMLPDRLFAATIRSIYGKALRGPVTKESWSLARRNTHAPVALAAGAFAILAASVAAIVIAGGIRLVGAFWSHTTYGPSWPSWLFVGSLVMIIGAGVADDLLAEDNAAVEALGTAAWIAAMGVLLVDAGFVLAGWLGLWPFVGMIVVVSLATFWLLKITVARGFARFEDSRNMFRVLLALAEGRSAS